MPRLLSRSAFALLFVSALAPLRGSAEPAREYAPGFERSEDGGAVKVTFLGRGGESPPRYDERVRAQWSVGDEWVDASGPWQASRELAGELDGEPVTYREYSQMIPCPDDGLQTLRLVRLDDDDDDDDGGIEWERETIECTPAALACSNCNAIERGGALLAAAAFLLIAAARRRRRG